MTALRGKVAVVTGAASGIGRATALLFAVEGARLALVDRDAAGLAATREALEEPARHLALTGDVADADTVAAHAAEIAATLGGIDILVAAAGFSCGGTVETTDPADWNAVISANLGGTYLWARAAVPLMRAAGGGSIITVASQLALAGGRGNAAYIAAKGAILSLTRTMAVDHAADSIRVNALVPGAIDTPLLARGLARGGDPEGARARSVARHPLGRLGRPEEVARAALFLASGSSSFTTGAALPVDGGWLAG
jgi:NAD(P)-dependent dehydrogenase (short-subunit alcohol dehydrogenase family)